MFLSIILEKMLCSSEAGRDLYLFYLCFFTKILVCYFTEPELISCTRVVIISYKINKWACKILNYNNILKDQFKTLKTLFVNE